jgi:hypothetical protein
VPGFNPLSVALMPVLVLPPAVDGEAMTLVP